MTNVRVASFNVRNGRALDGRHAWPFRRRAAIDILGAIDADVVGLQEAYAFQLRGLVRGLRRYAAVGDGRSDRRRGEHCPLLVRRDAVRIVEHRTVWFGPTPDVPGTQLPGAGFPRIATIATLRLGDSGPLLQVANTHLDERCVECRRASIEQLPTWLDLDLPQVLMGDFNAELDDGAFQVLEHHGLRSALPASAGGTNHDFSGRTDGRRIDHLFVSEQLEVLEAGVWTQSAGRLASDHWPVHADLRLR